jgi:hypothetical protein
VVDYTEDMQDHLRFGSELSLGMKRVKRNYDKKKNCEAYGGAQAQGGSSNSLGNSASQARRLLPIVIENLPPDRLTVVDKNDGTHLVTNHYIRDV